MNPGDLPLDTFGLTGTVLEGQYRADATIGEGGFGVVYRGLHLSLDQPIAIKVLKGLDGGDPRINALVLEKFRAEARLLYTLSQSSLHIVRALDYGATTMPTGAWAPFMILEWLDGRSLADDFSDRRSRGLRGRSLDEALAILRPVADGLSVAHQRQVAHRDIKPANIFLLGQASDWQQRTGPQGPQVKVLDFGIAKIMKDGEEAGTKGTFASFTWLYAAPEQLDPRLGATGLATDVYGVALLLTQLLTDRKPIDEPDVVGIMKAAMHPTQRPSPRARGANVPDAIESVCLRALAVDPKNRFPTISEFWEALSAAHGGSRATSMHQPIPASVVMTPPSAVAPRTSTVHAPASMVAPPSMVAASTQQPISPRNDPSQRITPVGPPPGTRPPGTPPYVPPMVGHSPSSPGHYPTGIAPPTGIGPPPGTRPPGYGPQMPYAASPPLGTPPPGQPMRRMPMVRSDGMNPVVIFTIVAVVFAILLAGACGAIHGACG